MSRLIDWWTALTPIDQLIFGVWVVLPLCLGTTGIICVTVLIALGRVHP